MFSGRFQKTKPRFSKSMGCDKMKGYIFDTSVLSPLLNSTNRRHSAVVKAIERLNPAWPNFVSAASLGELEFGVELAYKLGRAAMPNPIPESVDVDSFPGSVGALAGMRGSATAKKMPARAPAVPGRAFGGEGGECAAVFQAARGTERLTDSASAATLTDTVSPSAMAPSSSCDASGFSRDRRMARLRGRAPYTGS